MKDKMCQCQASSEKNDTVPLTTNIPAELMKQLQEAAVMEKTDLSSLILCYVQQGLINSNSQLKRQHFLTHAKDTLEKHGVHDKTFEEIFSKFPY